MKTKVLFATLLAFLNAGYAQTLDQAKLDQFFDRLAEKKKAMGSLAIVKDGEVLYTRAIGYSQIDGTVGKPLTTANRFRIGSITKMFTTTMILQLVEEGKLNLTDTLENLRFVYSPALRRTSDPAQAAEVWLHPLGSRYSVGDNLVRFKRRTGTSQHLASADGAKPVPGTRHGRGRIPAHLSHISGRFYGASVRAGSVAPPHR